MLKTVELWFKIESRPLTWNEPPISLLLGYQRADMTNIEII